MNRPILLYTTAFAWVLIWVALGIYLRRRPPTMTRISSPAPTAYSSTNLSRTDLEALYLQAFQAARQSHGNPAQPEPPTSAIPNEHPIYEIAVRDAYLSMLLDSRKPSVAIESALRYRNTPAGACTQDIVGEVALAYALRDPLAALNAIREHLSRPDQLDVYTQLEEACRELSPTVSVAAAVLRVHEDANPEQLLYMVRATSDHAAPRVHLPKWQRKTFYKAYLQYVGAPSDVMASVAAIPNSDDRWQFLGEWVSVVDPNDAESVLIRIRSLPGWERQDALVGKLVAKWASVADPKVVDQWVRGNTSGWLKLESLRGLRNAALARGDESLALALTKELRIDFKDDESPVGFTPATGAKLRLEILQSLSPDETIKLLTEWHLSHADLEAMAKDPNATPAARGILAARQIAMQAKSPDDWVQGFRSATDEMAPHLSKPLASILARQDLKMAATVYRMTQHGNANLSAQVLAAEIAEESYVKFGEEVVTGSQTVVEALGGDIPEGVRNIAFEMWFLKDRDGVSQWLMNHLSEPENQLLVESIVRNLMWTDKLTATEWAGALTDQSKRDLYLERLAAPDSGSK
jgi:hypothetical protein